MAARINPYTEGTVPAAPLAPFLRRAALDVGRIPTSRDPRKHGCAHPTSGIPELARVLAGRLGCKEQNLQRRIWRILAGNTQRLDVFFADELCVALDLMPTDVWGLDWYAGVKIPLWDEDDAA